MTCSRRPALLALGKSVDTARLVRPRLQPGPCLQQGTARQRARPDRLPQLRRRPGFARDALRAPWLRASTFTTYGLANGRRRARSCCSDTLFPHFSNSILRTSVRCPTCRRLTYTPEATGRPPLHPVRPSPPHTALALPSHPPASAPAVLPHHRPTTVPKPARPPGSGLPWRH